MTTLSSSMDSQIAGLERAILDLGRMAETAISRVIAALVRRDTLLARAIIEEDAEIDQAEVQVQEECLRVLEFERPSGADLRFVVVVLKINDSLERIGDLAENVAEVVVEVGDWERFLRVGGVRGMAEKAQLMVEQSLQAFIQRDVHLAREIIKDDERLDAMQDRIKLRIEHELDRIPENANPLMKLEHVTRQFERIGDIACNIAEEVIYLVEGEIVRHRLAVPF